MKDIPWSVAMLAVIALLAGAVVEEALRGVTFSGGAAPGVVMAGGMNLTR